MTIERLEYLRKLFNKKNYWYYGTTRKITETDYKFSDDLRELIDEAIERKKIDCKFCKILDDQAQTGVFIIRRSGKFCSDCGRRL